MKSAISWSLSLLFLCLCSWTGGESAAQTQSRYVRKYDRADTVIVFVHGVLGDSVSTWTNGRTYWPDLLTRDDTFAGTDIYVYQYPTGVNATLSVDETSEHMRLLMDTSGVSSHRRIIFLAHSMGGLITRAYLLKNRRVADQTAFLYFFSTPTTGSEVASLAAVILRTPAIRNMQILQPAGYLADLQRQWLAARFSLPSYCAYEKRATLGFEVVTQASASNLCTQRLDPIDADHISIVKPADENDIPYLAFKSAFKEVIPTVTVQPKPTFDIHPSFADVYKRYAGELGQPLGPAQLSDDTYQAAYERALIVWIKSLLAIYVLPFNNDERKVIRQSDSAFAPAEFFDDGKLRAMFGTPDDKLPPHGGVAYHWNRDPDRWKFIGWREWYCRFFDEVFYQEFQSGIIFGVFHLSPTRDEGQVLVVLNNGRWQSGIAPRKAPDCLQISDPFPTRPTR